MAPPPQLTTLTPPNKEDKIMIQVMLDMGNGQKFPMNIPAANFGISANSLPSSLVSKQAVDASQSCPPASVAPVLSAPISVAPVAPVPSVAAPHTTRLLQYPSSVSSTAQTPVNADRHPFSAVTRTCKEEKADQLMPSPSTKQQLKAALRKQLGNSVLQQKRPAENDICDLNISEISEKQFKHEDDEDEGRRSKFLERNRAAAARCRKKKKQWIKVLQQKSGDALEINKKLMNETIMLRNEVAKLKMLLLEHKDCPVTKARLLRPTSTTTPPPSAAASSMTYDPSELTFTTLTARDSAAQLLASMDTSQLLSPSSCFDGSDTTDGSDSIN